jgi:hypothetical protein
VCDEPVQTNTLYLIVDANFLEEWAFLNPRRIVNEVGGRQHDRFLADCMARHIAPSPEEAGLEIRRCNLSI